MNAIALLSHAATHDSLPPAMQRAICEALRRHLFDNANLETALNLRTKGRGPNPRTLVLRTARDEALQALWEALGDHPPPQRGLVAADLLRRRARASDALAEPPADDIEALADEVCGWNGHKPLSACRIRKILD